MKGGCATDPAPEMTASITQELLVRVQTVKEGGYDPLIYGSSACD